MPMHRIKDAELEDRVRAIEAAGERVTSIAADGDGGFIVLTEPGVAVR